MVRHEHMTREQACNNRSRLTLCSSSAGEMVTKQPLIRSMRTVKRETLKLISGWVSRSNDPQMVSSDVPRSVLRSCRNKESGLTAVQSIVVVSSGWRELRSAFAGGRSHRLPKKRSSSSGTRSAQHYGNHRQQARRSHNRRDPQNIRRCVWVHPRDDQQG